MSDSRPGDPRFRPSRWLGAAGALLAVLGAVLLLAGLANPGAVGTSSPPESGHGESASPATSPSIGNGGSGSPAASPSTTIRSPQPERTAAQPSGSPANRPRLTESAPVRVLIPTLQVDAATVELGVGSGGALETPSDPDDVGWFVGAHTPGGPGTAVVAGHVTWNGRPTVFHRLDQLKAGDKVRVERADGRTARFEVTRRETFSKQEFPTSEVYGASATPQLILITCGGAYDADRRYYDSNVVVWARLVTVSD